MANGPCFSLGVDQKKNIRTQAKKGRMPGGISKALKNLTKKKRREKAESFAKKHGGKKAEPD